MLYSLLLWRPAAGPLQTFQAQTRVAQFEIAGGQIIGRDVAETIVRYEGETRTTIVVFGEEGSPPLLGAYTLEGLRLAADPLNGRLVPVRGLAMTTTPAIQIGQSGS